MGLGGWPSVSLHRARYHDVSAITRLSVNSRHTSHVPMCYRERQMEPRKFGGSSAAEGGKDSYVETSCPPPSPT
jgi:hypothetical protein